MKTHTADGKNPQYLGSLNAQLINQKILNTAKWTVQMGIIITSPIYRCFFPSYKPSFSSGIFQPATSDDSRQYPLVMSK